MGHNFWYWYRRNRSLIPLLLAGTAILAGLCFLGYLFSLFQNAYLGSLIVVPGSQVTKDYIASVRFALEGILLTSLFILFLVWFLWREAVRWRRY